MSGRHPSPSKNRDDGRRRNNNHHHNNNRPTTSSSSGRHHDGPPHRQHHRQHHSNNNEQQKQPPPYSRYTNHSITPESRWREPSSSPSTRTNVMSHQQPSSPTNKNNSNQKRAISFAEKRRLQEKREFANSFSTKTVGMAFNDDTDTTTAPALLLRRQHSGGSQASSSSLSNNATKNQMDKNGGVPISNGYLKDVLCTAAVGSASSSPTAATPTANAAAANTNTNTTMSTTDNEVTSTTTNTKSNSTNSGGGGATRDNGGKTSINLANYSSSGKRLLGGSSSAAARFVVDNKTNDGGGGGGSGGSGGGVSVYSGLAAAVAPSASTATATTGNNTTNSTSSNHVKPSSILKRSSILKSSSNYSSQVGQQPSSANPQQQSQSQSGAATTTTTTTQNKVDWGDNSTREIESRLPPVVAMMASANTNVGAGSAGGNNNFIRRNSNETHPNNTNVPPSNHPNTNFNRHGSGGGGGYPQSPTNNTNNNNFTRRNSGDNRNNNLSRKMGFNKPCQIEEHKGLHKWKDCPNNPHSDNYNNIHHRTASHQQLLDSVQVERQQQFQRMQLQQQQRRQKVSNLQEQEVNRVRGGVGNPPAVVAASSLKRPAMGTTTASILKSNATSAAVAAARRFSESSNLFNTTKSARTLKSNGSIPKKQRTTAETMHSSSTTAMQIPRKKTLPMPPFQSKKVDLRSRAQQQQQQHHQSNVEYKNGRFQRRTSNNHLAPSGQDAVPITKQTSGRIVSKAKKPPSSLIMMRGREDTVSRGSGGGSGVAAAAHRGTSNNESVAAMDTDTDESHHTLMDDEIIELDDFGDFGTIDLVDNDDDDNDGSNGGKEKASSTTPSSSKGMRLVLVRDPEKNRKSVSRKEKKNKKGDGGDEKEARKKNDRDDEKDVGKKNGGDDEKEIKKKKDDDGGEKKKAKKKKDDGDGEKKIAKEVRKKNDGDDEDEKKVRKKSDDGGEEKKDDGGDEKKKDSVVNEKKAKRKNDDGDDDKRAKKKKDNGGDDKVKTTQDGGDDEKDEKKKPDSNKLMEKKKRKRSKKKCRNPGCDAPRLRRGRFCKAHNVVASKKSEKLDAPASEIDNMSSRAAKPVATKEGENDPKKKVKAKKRGMKRKSPPELTPNVAPLNNGNDVLAAGASSSNKRQALEIHRSSNSQNHLDQLIDELLPDLEDEEVEEMEADLFHLLGETIKIRYQNYVEEHKIDEDLLLEEEQALLEVRREDTSPPDENSLAKDVSPPNGDKENMPSALLNSLTDNTSMDTGDDSDDDDQIPLFYTCEKCDRVFFSRSQVVDHENQCTNTKATLDGRVFTNPNDIAEFYEKNHSGGEIKSDCVIFYRPPVTSPFDISGRTISPEDFEGRGGSRNDVPQNLLDDFMSSKSPQAASEKEKKKVETDFQIDPNNTRDACMVMNAIEHLSSTVINPDGLPSQTITTFCSETETLYDFRVEIKPSKIPNSGLGAFVTFLGARVLRKDASVRCARLLGEHVTHDSNGNLFVKTQEVLTAEMYGGRTMNVTLKGNNLHHNDNSLYWSKERQEYLKKHVEKNGTLLDHFEEDEICCKVNSEVKKYRSNIPEGERIGFLGIHSESDYVEDKTVVFSSEKSGLGMLELGRYGPHRRIDVKDNLHFCFKNFIFDFEPSEWSYGVSDQRLGRDQAIDITDDATGEVHSLARQSTPIYVNEVGNNKKLHCNVDIRHTDECAVYYYIFIDKDHAMKAGDQVELLVDYGEAYEDVRERKGYGKDNNEILGGDFDDDAARLKRNFVDREMAQLDIHDLKLFDMYYLVEYLTNNVLAPIDLRIRHGHMHGQAESFTRLSKDVIARQRMHWLKIYFQRRLKEMMTNPDPNDELLIRSMRVGGKEMVGTIEKSLVTWDFAMLPDIFPFLNTVPIGGNKTLQDVIFHELSEEMLYFVASKLPDPLNRTVWSKISIDLTESTTRDIARYFVYCKEPMLTRVQILGKQLLENAKNAANKVREACSIVNTGSSSLSRDAAIDKLSFHSLSRKMKKKDIAPSGSLINVYANDLNIDYGAAATIADIQAYQDAVELGYLEPYFNPCSSRRLTDTKLSMVSQYPSRNHQNGNQQFHRMARSVDAFKSGVARVNEQWYLLNQILLPVHTLASECVKWKEFPAGYQSYSVEKLCEAIGVELEDAKETIKRGVIRPNWPELEDKPNNGTNNKKKKRMRGVLSNAARTVEHCQSEDFPGWTVERIQRKNSHHVDSYFTHPGLDGVILRSRVGVREMISKMETNLIDVKAAYDILMREGKQKYFGGRRA